MASLSPLLTSLSLASLLITPVAHAADTAPTVPPPARKPAKVAAKPKAPVVVPAEVVPEPATPEQISASERVYYGEYDCDFQQTIHIAASERHPSYVELRYAKNRYLMKPVLSSTGAIRLEDVKGQTLMIQIASKSMLMNVKTGTRLVDACVSQVQRVAIESAKASPPPENTLLTAPRP